MKWMVLIFWNPLDSTPVWPHLTPKWPKINSIRGYTKWPRLFLSKIQFKHIFRTHEMNRFWSKFRIFSILKKFQISKKLDFQKKKSGSLCISTYRVYFGLFLGSNEVKQESNPKDSKKIQNHSLQFRCIIVKLSQKNLSHVSVCFLEGVTDAMIISCRARNNDDASSRVPCCERQPDCNQ